MYDKKQTNQPVLGRMLSLLESLLYQYCIQILIKELFKLKSIDLY